MTTTSTVRVPETLASDVGISNLVGSADMQVVGVARWRRNLGDTTWDAVWLHTTMYRYEESSTLPTTGSTGDPDVAIARNGAQWMIAVARPGGMILICNVCLFMTFGF